jgi:CRISPR-associated endoribonuclease Cas6
MSTLQDSIQSLTTHHLLFTTEVVTPLQLDDHSGSALRGMLFDAIWKRFCTNKVSPSCADCPLHTICPVSAIVAPLREEHVRGRDIPRPYVLLPPLGEARDYVPGDLLLFGLTLFGSIVQLLPYIILSLGAVETYGLGLKCRQNGWKRGTFRVKYIESYHPFSGEKQRIYEAGRLLVQSPTCSTTPADIVAQAATLSTERITLDFLTPTRLVENERPMRQVAFRPLIFRLLERLAALTGAYGNAEVLGEQGSGVDQQSLIALATDISCEQDCTRWEEVKSYSNRQHCFTHISGLIGKATFVGDLKPFRELLTWGELIHVGKNAVKGNGWYRIVPDA